MGRRPKKPRMVEYADEQEREKVAELEEFLFGGSKEKVLEVPVLQASDSSSDDDSGPLNLTALLRRGDTEGVQAAVDAMFVEDRAGERGGGDESGSDGADGSDGSGGSAGSSSGDDGAGSSGNAGAGSSGDDGAGSSGDDDARQSGDGGGGERVRGADAGQVPRAAHRLLRRLGKQQEQQQQQQQQAAPGSRAPVWSDPADQQLRVEVAQASRLRKLRSNKDQLVLRGERYTAALRKQHVMMHPRTGWAKALAARAAAGADADADDEEGGGELLRSAAGLLAGGGGGGCVLRPGSIDLTRLRDANLHGRGDAVVQSLGFHPGGHLLFTAGFDKKLRLFSVDGLRNPLVQSVHLDDMPIHTAAFAGADGSQLVAAGRRPFYYVADLQSGAVERIVAPPLGPGGAGAARPRSLERFAASPALAGCGAEPLLAFLGDAGHVGLVSLRSRQAVGGVKMNGSARCAAFGADGLSLVTSGGDGVIYTWDLRSTRRCVSTQADEGCVAATSLALSADGRALASGSASGVVNVYRRPGGLLQPLGDDRDRGPAGGGGAAAPARPAAPAPAKALMQLTTSVDSMAFSTDGQLLVTASRLERDAMRLVHVPSLSAYANWPTSRTPLHYVHCTALSPRGGYLAVGNAKGRVLLYRLHHYAEA